MSCLSPLSPPCLLTELFYVFGPSFKEDYDAFTFDRLHPDRQNEIWNDPNWTRAILIREPAERLLSGFLDKVVSENYLNYSTLEQFVESLEQPPTDVHKRGYKTGLTWLTDPHW